MGTLCEDLYVEAGGRAVIRGTVVGTVHNDGGVVEVWGVIGAITDLFVAADRFVTDPA